MDRLPAFLLICSKRADGLIVWCINDCFVLTEFNPEKNDVDDDILIGFMNFNKSFDDDDDADDDDASSDGVLLLPLLDPPKVLSSSEFI